MLIGCVIVAAVATVLLESGPSPYVVRAEFADAEGLQPDFSVRDQGVVVGNVASVSLTGSDRAMVTLDLDRSIAPIGAGATASINPSNLLGEKYVELDPGDVDHPQPSGTLIPLSRTSEAPELDQVLDAFDPDTRQATAVFLAEEGDALLGRGQSLGTVLSDLPSSLQSARQFVSGLASDNQALGRLIDESDQILAAAAPQRTALGRLVSSADGAFSTLASRQGALAQTISGAPATLAQLRQTLVSLQSAAGPLGTAASGLRAAAPSLTATLQAVPAFATAALPTLRTAITTAPALDRLGRDGTPVVAALDPTASRLADFTGFLAPVSKLLNGNIGAILDVIQGWARAIADRDGIGHIYRVEALLPPNTLNSILGAIGISASLRREYGLLPDSRPVRHRSSTGHRTAAAHETATPAPTASGPGAPVKRPSVLPPLPGGSTGGSGSPAGTASTVSSLLNYLLGK